MSRKILGLDIRKESVSAVLLQSKIKGLAIEAHAYLPLSGPDGVKQGVIDCVQSLMKEADLAGATCVAAYPSENIFYRNLSVPFKEQKKIRQILPYELEPMLPLPAEDLIIDFHVSSHGSHNAHTDVLAAAAEISGLRTCLETLAEAKLVPAVLTAGGYAAAFYLAGSPKTAGACLFLDAGAESCGLYAIVSGRICYARSFSLHAGEQAPAAAICRHVRQTLAAVREILPPEMDPGVILATGSLLEDSALLNEIARQLQMPITRTDLLQGTNATIKNFAVKAWQPLRMDNALALALSELEGLAVFNFRKGPFAPRKHWIEHRHSFLRTGLLAGLMALLAFMDIAIDNHFMEKKLAGLDAQITRLFKSTFPTIEKIVDPLQQMRVEIQTTKKQSAFPESSQKNIRNIDLLQDISRLIPRNVTVELNRIVIGPGSVQISGYTDTFNSVNNFQRNLQSGKLFKEVTINSANIEKTENRVSFKLNLQL